MNWFVIIPVGIAVIAAIVFMVIRNQKDEKQLERQLNDDLPKTRAEDADRDGEEAAK